MTYVMLIFRWTFLEPNCLLVVFPKGNESDGANVCGRISSTKSSLKIDDAKFVVD